MNWLARTELLLGTEKIAKLKNSHVLVVGLGGVGAYAAEMLCRAGIGKMTIVDGDNIEVSNINRQLPATLSNVGKMKADILAQRFVDINPEIEIEVINEYLRDERMLEILQKPYDYVVDAIDTLSPKVYLIFHSLQLGLKIVSSMGSGGKINPELVKTTDISKSYNCKLARMLRKRLGRLGVRKGFKVVFSAEEVPDEAVLIEEGINKKSVVGTISYMPPVFGCHIAAVVINDLINS
ncbi:MAG TPA: tRNA threonylcarbamoyladenosine dehydratase [Prolixibacteraceae bacterium]|nr:tRNA threonylcarbamoyladenosine dehydratase [Prolixibacteraceae bacterium]HPR59325.1 tRNA threonylcarbamoyladenosine dehydratase [Prolixibacteraceae bacterium]